jgi:hypothetical protein
MSALLDPFRGPVFQALGWALVHFLWQGVIVAVVTRTALGALRGASSSTRYLVACAGLMLMAAAPVATTLSVYRGADADASAGFSGDARPFTVGVAPAGGSSSVVTPSLPADAGRGVPDGFSDGGGARGWVERAAEGVRPWLPLVVLAWMAGVALGAVRLAGAWLHLRRLRTRWTSEVAPAWTAMTERLVRQMGIRRPVRLLESARMQVPAVMGALKPVILVPAGLLAGLAPQDVELILAHELAHVRRHDYVVNLLQSVLETVLFFHPAVWWLSGVVRDEREHCCDDAVVGATKQGKRYARALLAAEELRATGPGPMLAPALGGGSLYRRVRRIVAPAGDVPTGGGVGPVVTVLMMAGLLVGGTPLGASERAAVTSAQALAADTTGELGRKWAQARARAVSEGWVRGVWIGYAVNRRGMDVDGVRSNSDGEGSGTEETLSTVLARPGGGVVRMGDLPAASQVVLLFRLGGGGDAVPRVMKIRTPESPADLDDAPLVWLGTAPDGESLALLRDLYASTGPEVRREMAAAASLHGEGAGALAFVRTVLDTEPVPEVRAQAAYWLQYQRTHGAMALMERTARRDSSVKVREEAVTGIAKTASPEGWRVLALIARTAPSAATREEAGDWLQREGPGSENERR